MDHSVPARARPPSAPRRREHVLPAFNIIFAAHEVHTCRPAPPGKIPASIFPTSLDHQLFFQQGRTALSFSRDRQFAPPLRPRPAAPKRGTFGIRHPPRRSRRRDPLAEFKRGDSCSPPPASPFPHTAITNGTPPRLRLTTGKHPQSLNPLRTNLERNVNFDRYASRSNPSHIVECYNQLVSLASEIPIGR